MSKPKIIILGAGVAGLAAGNVLNKNCDVKILEARDRVGGRVAIDHSLGIPLSRGAAWIHGAENNPICELASQFPTKLVYVPENKLYIFNHEGTYIEDEKISAFNQKMEAYLEQSKQFAFGQKIDISLSMALSHVMEPISYEQQSLFEKNLKFFENYIGANYERLSARYWNEEENLVGGHAFLDDSYEAIIKGLSSPLSINFNTVVEAIQENSNEIKIFTNKGVFSADAVIVTFPLGVLKQNKISFQPALSIEKQKAIECLGMGLFNIVAMRFETQFWPNDSLAFFIPDSPTCSIFFNGEPVTHAPILLGYVGGDTASKLEKQSDHILIEKTVEMFNKLFKKRIPFPDKYFITRWSEDPYSLGSYSFLPVGATPEDRDRLAKPESDRLFFAGEATHEEYPATVHGAYLSGIREAERIKAIYIHHDS